MTSTYQLVFSLSLVSIAGSAASPLTQTCEFAGAGCKPIDAAGEDASLLQMPKQVRGGGHGQQQQHQRQHQQQSRRHSSMCGGKPYPLIFDNDANYDDMLAFLYIAANPLFDLKAITVEATGMSTPSGGPPNMAALAAFAGHGQVPIAYGQIESLSPIATMPLEWRTGLDMFVEKLYPGGPNGTIFEMSPDAIVPQSAPHLILDVLRNSACPVVVLTTGPVTNLAVALDMDPSAVDNIEAVFMMGSAYGVPGTNNVYDWQIEYNGVKGGCSEVGPQTYTGLSPPLETKDMVRRMCRGVNMSEKGDTEWNLFMDVRAWKMTYNFLSQTPAPVYVIAANATLNMPVTKEHMEEYARKLNSKRLKVFMIELAKSFVGAGEAKWWDAQCAVMMADVLSGVDAAGNGVCAGWAHGKRTSVDVVWRSELHPGEKQPYGQVKDEPDADSPLVDYCLLGNSSAMWTSYWPMIDKLG